MTLTSRTGVGSANVVVIRLVEGRGMHGQISHLADDVARQQQRAELALLGIEVVRRHPPFGATWPGLVAAVARIASNVRHGAPTLHQRRCGSLGGSMLWTSCG